MSKNEQMILYKESFFTRLKRKIKSLFFKSNIKAIEEAPIVNTEDEEKINKKEIMQLYNDVKDEKVNLKDVKSKDLYKIMLLLKEEIEIVDKKFREEIKNVDIHYNNLKIYNTELQLLAKKDS